MIKKILLVLLFLNVSILGAKELIVIADTSHGMMEKEAGELYKLMNPKTIDYYKNKDKFTGYVFTEKRMYSKSEFYYEKGKNKKKYRLFNKAYKDYGTMLKKGINKKNTKLYKEKSIVFLIDTSGSMKKDNLMNRVKKALEQIALKKHEQVKIAIVTFDGKKSFNDSKKARKILDFTSDVKEIVNTIRSINYSQNDTFMGVGLNVSLNLLDSKKTKNKTIFVVTDGAKINDESFALREVERAKRNDINIKVVAVGGASIPMLRKISTTRYVYDLTKGDLEAEIEFPNMNDDTLFYYLNTLTARKFKSNNSKDTLIIYSHMMEVSDLFDFYNIPNLSDGPFYREVKKKLAEKQYDINFHGIKIYVRVTGDPEKDKAQELRLFWKRFIKDHNGELVRFGTDRLDRSEIK